MMSHVDCCQRKVYAGKVEMRLRVSGVIDLHHIRPTYTARAALQHAEVARSVKWTLSSTVEAARLLRIKLSVPRNVRRGIFVRGFARDFARFCGRILVDSGFMRLRLVIIVHRSIL